MSKGTTAFFIIGLFLVAFLFLVALNPNPSGLAVYSAPIPPSVPSYAIPINQCYTPLFANNYYYLTDDIYEPSGEAQCFNFDTNITLNCNGHTINGGGVLGSAVFSMDPVTDQKIYNCHFVGIVAPLSFERLGNAEFRFNTFNQSTNCITSGYFWDNVLIENNVFECGLAIGIPYQSAEVSKDTIIRNNWFKNVPGGTTIYWSPGNAHAVEGWKYWIYNNRFDGGNKTIVNPYDAFTNVYNLSDVDIPGRIFGSGHVGGNYYGSCIDGDCNGYCDDPAHFGNDNNLDLLPLSQGC